MSHNIGVFGSVEEAERKLRQATHGDHAKAINSHADAIEELNRHHEVMHAAVTKLQDQMEAVLGSLHQINQRLDHLESLGVVAEDLRQTMMAEQMKTRDHARG